MVQDAIVAYGLITCEEQMDGSMERYLVSGTYVDSGHAAVQAFARRAASDAAEPAERARRLYNAVRDEITYDPYIDYTAHDSYRASACLAVGRGFCVGKAAVMAAAARVLAIPARVGFADVRNHLASRRLLGLIGGDVFIYHGYAELFLDGSWVKVTPTFNLALCERFGVRPLEFDGRHDALFHPFDSHGRRHMEYLQDRGPADDVPADEIIAAVCARYPKLCVPGGVGGAMHQETSAAG